jgi:type II secretion system protein I
MKRPLRTRQAGMRVHGFTLIEVLVALAIVAIALTAGLQATASLTNNAQRQSSVLLAQLCAENELVKVRLARQMPGVGERRTAAGRATSTSTCAHRSRRRRTRTSCASTPRCSRPPRRCSGCPPWSGGTDMARRRPGASRWSNCWWRCSRSR